MSYATGIGNLSQPQGTSAAAETKARETGNVSANAPKESEASSGTVEHADQAKLSSTGGLMAQILEGSDVRTEKVAALQQAIASGSYNVSSSDVADKIIKSLLE